MRKKRWLLPYALAAVISVAVFFATAGFLFADLFFSKDDSKIIDVPSYVGMDEDSISFCEIEIERSYSFSDTVAKGLVISQSRKGRVKVASGEKLVLGITVSLGKETHVLPELKGLDIYEASEIIRKMGCVPRTVFSESEERADSVLFTLPKPSSELYEGEVVTLYVATRTTPKTVRVPDFYGCSLNNLQSQVEDAGLTLGKIEFIYSEDFLPDTVVYQSVGKNCLVKNGASIDFYIARNP